VQDGIELGLRRLAPVRKAQHFLDVCCSRHLHGEEKKYIYKKNEYAV
jgi:hypothetical protein